MVGIRIKHGEVVVFETEIWRERFPFARETGRGPIRANSRASLSGPIGSKGAQKVPSTGER